jgi:serine/threonine protein kinase
LNGEYAEEIKSLLERMIVYEEDNRIKFEDLFSHKLFTMPLQFNDPLIVEIEGNHNERIKKVLDLFYHKF